MRSAPFALALLILVAACGQPAAPAPSPTATLAADGYVAKVRALSDRQRAGVLLRAIRDAGQNCQAVVAQAPAEAQGASAAWVATCDDKAHWVVVVADDGTAHVVDAKDVAKQAPAAPR